MGNIITDLRRNHEKKSHPPVIDNQGRRWVLGNQFTKRIAAAEAPGRQNGALDHAVLLVRLHRVFAAGWDVPTARRQQRRDLPWTPMAGRSKSAPR